MTIQHLTGEDVPPQPANRTLAQETAYVNHAVSGYVYDHAPAHQEAAAKAVLRACLNTLRALRGPQATADFCAAYARELSTIS
jgi:hypothetical protein